MQIFVANKPVHFRKGHDGLAVLAQSHLKKKPFDGAVYVFRAKRADRLEMIWWGGSRLVIAYKRLEQDAFKGAAIRDGVLRPDSVQFEALFAGLDWRRVTSLETCGCGAGRHIIGVDVSERLDIVPAQLRHCHTPLQRCLP